MRIIDCTHVICAGMPVYPGTEPPLIKEATTLEKEGFAEKLLTFYSHTGTHMDAPAHLLPSGPSLDSFQTAHFVGPGVILDCRECKEGDRITLEVLEPLEERLATAAFLVLHTGWSRFWGTETYFGAYPALTLEACQWLARFPLQGIAMDTISIDPITSEDLPNHRVVLGEGMVIVENLVNLDQIESENPLFCFLPLKIEKSDGAPIRAIAMY